MYDTPGMRAFLPVRRAMTRVSRGNRIGVPHVPRTCFPIEKFYLHYNYSKWIFWKYGIREPALFIRTNLKEGGRIKMNYKTSWRTQYSRISFLSSWHYVNVRVHSAFLDNSPISLAPLPTCLPMFPGLFGPVNVPPTNRKKVFPIWFFFHWHVIGRGGLSVRARRERNRWHQFNLMNSDSPLVC